MLIVAHWFRAFAWTLALEQLVAGLLLRRPVPARGRRISLITVANLASHPAVWFVFPELGAALGLPRWASLAASELWAVAIEAWIYWLLLGSSFTRVAFLASLAANATSLGCGYALRAWGLV